LVRVDGGGRLVQQHDRGVLEDGAGDGHPLTLPTRERRAAYTGTAPILVSSGNTYRYRLARGGNRQLNTAIHRIALIQIRLDGPGRAYYQRRRPRERPSKKPSAPSNARSPEPSTNSSNKTSNPYSKPLDIGATDSPGR
jgi:hypothetical protein